MLITIVAAVAGLYLSLVGLIWVFQDRLLYPGAMTQGTGDARVVESPTTTLLRKTLPDGTPIVARFDAAPGAAADKLTVIYFYGNGMCMAYADGLVDMMRDLGCDVLMPDYPGYGLSGGKTTEAGIYAAADAMYDEAISRGAKPERILVVGLSLGGAVAIDLASRKPVGGVATISTFTTMPAMARLTAPRAPTSLILRPKFDSLSKISRVAAPKLLIHGQEDEMIPVDMCHALAGAGGAETVVIVPHADHNNIFGVGHEPVRAALDAFVKRLQNPAAIRTTKSS